MQEQYTDINPIKPILSEKLPCKLQFDMYIPLSNCDSRSCHHISRHTPESGYSMMQELLQCMNQLSYICIYIALERTDQSETCRKWWWDRATAAGHGNTVSEFPVWDPTRGGVCPSWHCCEAGNVSSLLIRCTPVMFCNTLCKREIEFF